MHGYGSVYFEFMSQFESEVQSETQIARIFQEIDEFRLIVDLPTKFATYPII